MSNKVVDAAFKQLQDALTSAQQRLAQEAKRLEDTLAASSCGKIQKVERVKLPALNRIETYDPNWNGYRGPDWKVAVPKAEAVLAQARLDIEAQHTANLVIIEANRVVYNQVVSLMTHVGIPQSTSKTGYATPKARKMTTTVKGAGYLEDLREHCPRDDGYDDAKRRLADFERSIESYKQAGAKKEAEEEAKRKAERVKRDQAVRMVRLGEKYGVSTPDDAHEVLEAILSKDKYLSLAHAMAAVRYDWNDGPGAVSNALDRFEVVSDEDRAVFEEIHGFVEDWDGDGRVFRDCKYNYSYLRVKVPDELLSDYDEYMSLTELVSLV